MDTSIPLRKIKKGQKIFSQNDKSREMYFLKTGQVKIQRVKDGEVLDLAVLTQGSVFGEMSLLDAKPRSATAVAVEDCELSIINMEEFQRRTDQVPAWYLSILRVASERLRGANERLSRGDRLQNISNVAQLVVLILKKQQNARRPAGQAGTKAPTSVDMKMVKQELLEVLGLPQTVMEDSLAFLEQKEMLLAVSNRITVEEPDSLLNYAKYLKTRATVATEEPLMEEEVFNQLRLFKGLLDQQFKKSPVVSFSFGNFEAELLKTMGLPRERLEWFLTSLQQYQIVSLLDPTGAAIPYKSLNEHSQLRFDNKYLAEVLQQEGFKRLGV